jgi:hypothetical protein
MRCGEIQEKWHAEAQRTRRNMLNVPSALSASLRETNFSLSLNLKLFSLLFKLNYEYKNCC